MVGIKLWPILCESPYFFALLLRFFSCGIIASAYYLPFYSFIEFIKERAQDLFCYILQKDY